MSKQFQKLDPKINDFISRQHIFFTATAAKTSRINISPRSTDCLRILDDNTIIYFDKTGSGNETAAHLLADGRMTIMMCAVDGPPQILRLYGRGRVIHRESAEYADLLKTRFDNDPPVGARQIILLDIELVQTSCGFAVPVFEYKSERDGLDRWTLAKTPDELEEYRRDKNKFSLDGLPTNLLRDEE